MPQQADGDGGRQGVFASVKNTLATLLSIGQTRLELLVVEIEEEKLRLMSLWSKAVMAAFLLSLGVIMAVFCLALIFWEQRVLVFGLFALLFIGGGLLLAVSLRRQAAEPSRLLRNSLSELDADIALLRQRHGQPPE
ncbi:MAG: phage holin family protein [Betaproteobacteria bacterium]|nr:phage holin family protein [Betaproteobacteria bacterium]MCL2885191.1 phage holin family protein [Betaproteobacteria bacterium]